MQRSVPSIPCPYQCITSSSSVFQVTSRLRPRPRTYLTASSKYHAASECSFHDAAQPIPSIHPSTHHSLSKHHSTTLSALPAPSLPPLLPALFVGTSTSLRSSSATSKYFVRRSSFVVRRSSFVVASFVVVASARKCQRTSSRSLSASISSFRHQLRSRLTYNTFKSLTTYGRTSVLWRRRRPRHARAAGFACRKCASACASACAHVCVCVCVSTGERNGGAMHTMWGTNDAFKPPHTGDIISQWHHSFRRGDAPSQMHGKVTYRERLFAALVGML